ncbi:endonuclease/exonuclease/phosphatase (EEP) superfamily protein YafD [Lewinella aquimaris]|uniref:Endonuclease/exonuclease/phosphatase (EEP) superfamily protein YafD n=1 Tax=Neolewinella aquimaris TaxID=1835722 RepID=A0A840DXZ4_9BACT|nr:endonuclease/exonuclease/phosphatase family protein [Neolewinella aquimaris]MBB4077851.1 endonuclease/exonuclease/phosphatase (EEP) superfamily protein YafD [Neolewinella aquimaris]
MIILRILAYVLGAFGIIGTVMPFLKYDDWWIRGFDYPRQQLLFLLGLSAVLWFFSRSTNDTLNLTVGIVLMLATLYQAYRIYPYTPLHGRDARNAERTENTDGHLTLMMSNVLQTNKRTDLVIDLALKMDPDILLTVESNGWWEEKLREGLGEKYPHQVSVPLENLYGMHLWSKIELIDPEVKYRIKDDIPGIDTQIELPNGRLIDLHFVHPMPPSPTEAYASTGRDAELALVGLEVQKKPDATVIVAGDMNDVAWSHSSRLFQRLSGLLDPRRGRGFFSTFHAEYRMLRWPLDHVFHSSDLAVLDLQRLPYVGSDHFPVLISLSYEPEQDDNQGENPEGNDMEEATETIKKGKRHEDDAVIKGQD